MPFCRICEEFIFDHRPHKCPPEWELIRAEECSYARWGHPEWVLVHGDDEEEAIEKWAKRYDQNGDYDIVSRGGEEIVYIRKPADEEFIGPRPAEKWAVSGESVPHYHAGRVTK